MSKDGAKIQSGDIVAFRTGGSQQIGTVLKHGIMYPKQGHGHVGGMTYAKGQYCIQVLWNTPDSAGSRPEPFDRWNQEITTIMWYPTTTKGGHPTFKILSTMKEYSTNGKKE